MASGLVIMATASANPRWPAHIFSFTTSVASSWGLCNYVQEATTTCPNPSFLTCSCRCSLSAGAMCVCVCVCLLTGRCPICQDSSALHVCGVIMSSSLHGFPRTTRALGGHLLADDRGNHLWSIFNPPPHLWSDRMQLTIALLDWKICTRSAHGQLGGLLPLDTTLPTPHYTSTYWNQARIGDEPDAARSVPRHPPPFTKFSHLSWFNTDVQTGLAVARRVKMTRVVSIGPNAWGKLRLGLHFLFQLCTLSLRIYILVLFLGLHFLFQLCTLSILLC